MTYANHLSEAWKEYVKLYRLMAAVGILTSPITTAIVWAVSNFSWRQEITFGDCLLIGIATWAVLIATLIVSTLPMVFVEALIRTCEQRVDER